VFFLINAKSCAQLQIALRGVLTEGGRGRTDTIQETGFPASGFSASGSVLRLGGKRWPRNDAE